MKHWWEMICKCQYVCFRFRVNEDGMLCKWKRLRFASNKKLFEDGYPHYNSNPLPDHNMLCSSCGCWQSEGHIFRDGVSRESSGKFSRIWVFGSLYTAGLLLHVWQLTRIFTAFTIELVSSEWDQQHCQPTRTSPRHQKKAQEAPEVIWL